MCVLTHTHTQNPYSNTTPFASIVLGWFDLIHCLFNARSSSSSSFSITENHLTWKWCTFSEDEWYTLHTFALCMRDSQCSVMSCIYVRVCPFLFLSFFWWLATVWNVWMCVYMCAAFNNAKMYQQSDEKKDSNINQYETWIITIMDRKVRFGSI